MTISTAVFLFGGALLAIGIIGGGLDIREIKVPQVGMVSRILSAALGVVFMTGGIYLGVMESASQGGRTPPAQAQTPPTPLPSPLSTSTIAPTSVPPTRTPAPPPTVTPRASSVSSIRLGVDATYNFMANDQAILIDVRERSEYAYGHAWGAINIYFEEIERDPHAVIATLDPRKRVILYCD